MDKIMKRILSIIGIAVAVTLSSCKEEWLEPKPLSFFSPENTYINEDGLYAAVTSCERNMRHAFFGDHAPILTQLDLSDVAVFGKSDESQGLTDLDGYVTPSHVENGAKGKIGWFWQEGWNGIKYANIVLNRLDCAPTLSEEELAAIRGQGYFQRAWRYFNLVHEFGDVPWIDFEIQEPKLDFYTCDRWSILEQIEKDLAYAYEHVPTVEPRGRANKWSVGVLYMKVLMANQKWDEALAVGKAIIAANPLQTTRLNKSAANLQLDLHSIEAKMNPGNTEGLLYVVNITGYANDIERSNTMRNATPYWAKGSAVKTPEGKNGTANSCPTKDAGTYLDNDFWVGRGIGSSRLSNYYQYDVWTELEKNDERGRFNKDSWRMMEDLYYNASSAGSYYGKPLVRPATMSVGDSLRCWWSWPHYKVFVPDPTITADRRGGETPWYVYRTAEVYLMVAECYYWKGDLAQELAYINPVRERAKATPLTSVTGITEILAERARELYYEEFRHDELVRIAYTYAKTGKTCEAFNRKYTLEKFSGNGGDGENLKEYGYNFYWDWVTAKNGIMNRAVNVPGGGVVMGSYGELRMSVHHVLWPIPENAITSNSMGVINETPGYVTPYKRITPLKVGQSAPES